MLRKIYILSALLGFILSLQGCSRIKHEINTKFEADIYAVEIALKTDGYLFGGSAVFDPNINTETDNWDIIIKEFGEIRLRVVEANITDWLFAYQMELKITDNDSGKSLTHSIDGINSLHPDNSFELPLTPGNIAFFSEIIQKRHTATIEITGYSSQTGIELLFNFKITALVGLG